MIKGIFKIYNQAGTFLLPLSNLLSPFYLAWWYCLFCLYGFITWIPYYTHSQSEIILLISISYSAFITNWITF